MMKKSAALFAALGLLSTVAVLAAPPTDAKKPGKPAKTKTTDLWTCPITGEKITDHKSASPKTAVYGKYTVHFCCGGCPESFAKLSDKDKKAKVAAAVKTDTAPKKTDKQG